MILRYQFLALTNVARRDCRFPLRGIQEKGEGRGPYNATGVAGTPEFVHCEPTAPHGGIELLATGGLPEDLLVGPILKIWEHKTQNFGCKCGPFIKNKFPALFEFTTFDHILPCIIPT